MFSRFCLIALAFAGIVSAASPTLDVVGRQQLKSTVYVGVPAACDTCNFDTTTTAPTGQYYYTDSTGLRFVRARLNFKSSPISGLLLGSGTGRLKFQLEGGGWIRTDTITVDAATWSELRGYRIKALDSLGTTFTGPIHPLF
jgi:hypothetical protein